MDTDLECQRVTSTKMKFLKINFVQERLSKSFTVFGQLIGRHPFYFIIIPIILSAVLSTGFLKITFNRDFQDLFQTSPGRSSRDRNVAESLFPTNTSKHFDIMRLSSGAPGIMITILPKDFGSILRENVMNEIYELDLIAQTLPLQWKNEMLTYKNICAIKDDECYVNPIIRFRKKIDDFIAKKYRFRYPLEIDPLTLIFYPLAVNLGGVTTDENDYVEDIEALRLFYPTEDGNATAKEIGTQWENVLNDKLENIEMKYINVSIMMSSAVATEMKYFSDSILPLTGVVAIIVAVFSMLTCMSYNLVRSKPWLGVCGCISAGLAISATFGSVFLCSVFYTDINIVIPFLIIGTEIDDAYVLISSWRRTNPKDSVPERMGDAFSEAAVSITITSVTNLVSFCIGIATPFPIVRIFCIYAATSIFFTYVYQITFFGGCMAVSGYRERNGLHPITLRRMPIMDTKESSQDSKSDEIFATFFKDTIGEYLSKPHIKALVVMVFIGNMAGGIYGCLSINAGMKLTDILRSDTAEDVTLYYKYFTQYPFMLQVIVNQTLDFSDPSVQERMEEVLQRFEAHPNIAHSFTRLSWLKYFKAFSQNSFGKYLLSGYNLSKEEDFVSALREVYFRFPQAKQFRYDIIFNSNFTKIVSCRFMISLKNLNNRSAENKAVYDLHRITDESPLPIYTHSIFFPIIEHALTIRNVVFQVALMSSLLIIFIFLLFVPNLTSAICISVGVISSLCETVGYMALWGVSLDIISLIVLIMCVGFSINYPTHITFAYVMSKATSNNERLKDSLYHVGLPIFQGTTSTVLAVLVLAFEKTYMFNVFFKVVFLVAIQTAFHAMFVIPVMLTFVQCQCSHKSSPNNMVENPYIPYTYDDNVYLKLMPKSNDETVMNGTNDVKPASVPSSKDSSAVRRVSGKFCIQS